MTRPVPVDATRTDWPRLVANAVNELQKPQRGQVRFEGGRLQYWDGATWTDVP